MTWVKQTNSSASLHHRSPFPPSLLIRNSFLFNQHSGFIPKPAFCYPALALWVINQLHGKIHLPGTHHLLDMLLPVGFPQPLLLCSISSLLWLSWLHRSRHGHWESQQENLVKRKELGAGVQCTYPIIITFREYEGIFKNS